MAIALAGCGGSVRSDGATDGGAPGDTGTPLPDAGCAVDPGATPAEPAATPRADPEAEQLALTLGTRIVADQATYDRVVRDLAAIRKAHPEVADLHVFFRFVQSMRVFFDRPTIDALRAGTYHGWDCLDGQYGGVDQKDYSVATDGSGGSTTLKLRGFYATDRLACRYLTAPGVTQVQEGDVLIGDGSTVFAWTEGDAFHYAFDRAGGDCPAGCTTHDVSHFRSTPDGAVTLVDTFKTDPYGGTPTPFPAWWSHRNYTPSKCIH
ncbi:MAG: hypothetical protein ACXWP4_05555 [Polyangiales bacterium]